MVWLGLIVIVIVDLSLALLYWRLTIEVSAEARGEPGGVWALAGGLQVGPVAASGVAAAGLAPRGQVHVFGRKIADRELTRGSEPREEPTQPASERVKRWRQLAERGWGRLNAHVDPGELLVFLLQERRRIVVRQLDVDLAYSFRDILLTGKLLAALSVLSGMLPPPVRLRHGASWDWVDRGRASVQGSIVVWPGWMLVDTTWFVIRRVSPLGRLGGAKAASGKAAS